MARLAGAPVSVVCVVIVVAFVAIHPAVVVSGPFATPHKSPRRTNASESDQCT